MELTRSVDTYAYAFLNVSGTVKARSKKNVNDFYSKTQTTLYNGYNAVWVYK